MSEEQIQKQAKPTFLELRNTHIVGIVMVVFLLLMASSSMEMILWTGIRLATDDLDPSRVQFLEQALDTMPPGEQAAILNKLHSLLLTTSTSATVFTIIWLFVVIILLIVLNQKSAKVVAEYATFSEFNPAPFPLVKVKKVPYALLGFLLGTFGAHFFLIKREGKISKRAWIYLALGIAGIWLMPLMIYTTGISFADAWIACKLPRDEEKMITIVDYNRAF